MRTRETFNVTEPGTHFLDDQGREILDDTKISAPIGFEPTPNIMNQIRAMVRQELEQRGAEEDPETFEEADDFEVEDDDSYDPATPYEEQFWSMGVPPSSSATPTTENDTAAGSGSGDMSSGSETPATSASPSGTSS